MQGYQGEVRARPGRLQEEPSRLLIQIGPSDCFVLIALPLSTTGYSHSDRSKKLRNRLGQIQKWLGFSDSSLESWEGLGTGFLRWLIEQAEARNIPGDQVNERVQIAGHRTLFAEPLLDFRT